MLDSHLHQIHWLVHIRVILLHVSEIFQIEVVLLYRLTTQETYLAFPLDLSCVPLRPLSFTDKYIFFYSC
jgi:hypothetical protein